MADIEKAGLLVLCGEGVLLCRKSRDTSKLILPGGRIEPGESVEACLRREIAEELGGATLASSEYLGTYEDVASFDDAAVVKTLRIHLYRGEVVGAFTPASEIVELVWFGPGNDRSELTPIMVNRIVPDLVRRGILPW